MSGLCREHQATCTRPAAQPIILSNTVITATGRHPSAKHRPTASATEPSHPKHRGHSSPPQAVLKHVPLKIKGETSPPRKKAFLPTNSERRVNPPHCTENPHSGRCGDFFIVTDTGEPFARTCRHRSADRRSSRRAEWNSSAEPTAARQ